MKATFIILLVIALPISAEQIYKCTSETGHTAFQSTPCTVTQGQSETLDIDNEADSNYVPQAPKYYNYNSTTDSSPRYKSDYKKRRKETDKKICQIYKDALTNAEIKWKNVKMQGYKQWEKELYIESIRKAKQDVKRECS